MKVYVAAELGWEDFEVVGVFSTPELAKQAFGERWLAMKEQVVYVCGLDGRPELTMVRRYDYDEKTWSEWFEESP